MTFEAPDLSKIEQPLSPEDIAILREWQAAIPKIILSIQRAKSAGLDVTDRQETITTLKGKVDALLKVYG